MGGLRAKESVYGRTGEDTRVLGWITKSMDSASILGRMAGSIRAITKTIKNMALEHIPGRTGENMLASGKMISDTAEGNIS